MTLPEDLPQPLREAAQAALDDAEIGVITSANTPNPPPVLMALINAARADGFQIERLQVAEQTRVEPDSPLPAGVRLYEWQSRRVFGPPMPPSWPKPVEQTRLYWFAGLLGGNPCELEEWLERRGYGAFASSPVWCRVCEVGHEDHVDESLIEMWRQVDEELEA